MPAGKNGGEGTHRPTFVSIRDAVLSLATLFEHQSSGYRIGCIAAFQAADNFDEDEFDRMYQVIFANGRTRLYRWRQAFRCPQRNRAD